MQERSQWEGIFITSTTRVVKEVGTLRLPDEKGGSQLVEFAPHPLVAEISKLVFNAMKENATLILYLPVLLVYDLCTEEGRRKRLH